MFSESSETSGSNWYVVQTKPNAWQVAVRNLVRQGFEVFVPLLEHRQRLRQKVRLVHNPAFQGYIFVQFDPETSPWRAINSTFGVSRLVAFGGGVVPTMVPPPFIRALHARCDKDGILNGQENLRPGDKVR
jgi:transcriptional antiterminator RfaH